VFKILTAEVCFLMPLLSKREIGVLFAVPRGPASVVPPPPPYDSLRICVVVKLFLLSLCNETLRHRSLSYSRIPQHFMKFEGSLPCSQQHTTSLYLNQMNRVHTTPSISILYSHLRLGLLSDLFPLGFPTKALCAFLLFPISATCSVNLILLEFITISSLRKFLF
jgi:hypothetical protein